MENPRAEFKVSILKDLIPRMEKEAERKKWDIDMVIEEALVVYFNTEKLVGKSKAKKD